MPLFLGSRGKDILSSRTVSDLTDGIHERVDRERSVFLSGEEIPLLRELEERILVESRYEEEFALRFQRALEGVDREEDDLLPLRDELAALAREHFQRRRSVVAYFELCRESRLRLVRRSLEFAVAWLGQHGFGAVPVRYCWFAAGPCGRGEGSLTGGFESVLVHDDAGEEGASYFRVLARKGEELLKSLGLCARIAAAPAHLPWQGTLLQWRTRMADGMVANRGYDELAALMGLADIMFIHGDESLAGEMRNMVRGMLSFHREFLQSVARHVSEMTTGLDFFGRLRVDRSGSHRGLFNLEQYAVEPLVANVRVLAVKQGVTATGTVERIKEILERGALTVELAERLLVAFHEFSSLAVGADAGEEGWLDVERLAEGEVQQLKRGLEALVTLQRFVYQRFMELG